MRGYDIKWVDDNIPYDQILPLDWDIVVNHRPHKAYQLEGYYHSVGSRWDDVWCCPRDENPCKENLIGYAADSVCSWGIEVKENKYRNYKHEDVESSFGIIITRNGDHFYDFTCRDMSYGIAKAQTLITMIKEHPINFSSFEFEKQLIGRKIFYRDQPAIIRSYIHGQCCVMIEPDKTLIDKFSKPCWAYEDGDWDPYEQELKADCLEDHNIWWFRD